MPDLRNLDIYYDIGMELVQDNIAFSDDRAYRQAYRNKLAEWHDYAPFPYDSRLATEGFTASTISATGKS